LASKAAEKGLELAYLVDEKTPDAIYGDVTRLRQILINLVGNGIKFTQNGEVVISVSAEALSDAKNYRLHFSVRDTGIGIPPERMDRLFKSFSQVDASTTRRYGGTGLGLVISKRLTELMGGTMWVESKVGIGTTFHFTIQAQNAPSMTYLFLHEVQPQLRGKRLLIVDDMATNLKILTLQAQSWGMVPVETAYPRQALEWIKQGELFDVAILDMQMPDMDGLQLAHYIRNVHDKKRLPLIMLSSLAGLAGEAKAAEFAAVLTKPIKPSQMFDVLATVFSQQPIRIKPRKGPSNSQFDANMGKRLPLRILLAEDNTTNQKLALRLLERLGYRADVAANGLEVLQALARQPYDVVLMDIQMPEMDGLEATRRIDQDWAESRPHIIAMTANAMQGSRELCLAAGMDDYVSKPIRVERLVEALQGAAQARERGSEALPPQSWGLLRGGGLGDSWATGRRGEEALTKNQLVAEGVDGTKGASNPSEDGSFELDAAALEQLLEFVDGDTSFLVELIDSFLEEAPQLVQQLGQSLATSKTKGLYAAAHTLKPNCIDFGALRLSKLCQELEAIARAGSLTGSSELVTQIEVEYQKAEQALKEFRIKYSG
jgi:CheY-like chemotaxis protein/HPt (histidine-containing phosphotransfer) domain-containing protein